MKKIIIMCVMVLLSFNASASASNDPWYDIGHAIGSSIGNGPSGTDSKNFYRSSNYDFSKLKNMYLVVTIPKGLEKHIEDPYIVEKHTEYMQKELKKLGYNVITQVELSEELANNPVLKPYLEKDTVSAINSYLCICYPIYVNVKIYAYNNYSNGNVFLDFNLFDFNENKNILFYRDARLNAPRSSKEGMIKRITEQFTNKLNGAVEESREKHKNGL